MPTLTTKSGTRFFFDRLPTKKEVSDSPSLQKLVKACGGRLEPQGGRESEDAKGEEGPGSFPSNRLTPSEVESLRQDLKDSLAYLEGKSRHIKKEGTSRKGDESMDRSTGETPLTQQRALELLGLKEVPGGQEYSGIMIGGLERLLKSKGEEWVIQHRVGLVKELQAVADL